MHVYLNYAAGYETTLLETLTVATPVIIGLVLVFFALRGMATRLPDATSQSTSQGSAEDKDDE